jgi:hypothetical protein
LCQPAGDRALPNERKWNSSRFQPVQSTVTWREKYENSLGSLRDSTMIMNVALSARLECSQNVMVLKAARSAGACRHSSEPCTVCRSHRKAPWPDCFGSLTHVPLVHSSAVSKPKASRISGDQAWRAAAAATAAGVSPA